jgi:hypothetical protein
MTGNERKCTFILKFIGATWDHGLDKFDGESNMRHRGKIPA